MSSSYFRTGAEPAIITAETLIAAAGLATVSLPEGDLQLDYLG